MVIATKLDHVAIAAENTVAMAQWYHDTLGFVIHVESGPTPPQTQKVFMIGPPLPPPSKAIDAQAGPRQGLMIEVMPRNDTPRYNRNRNEPGISHIAWVVPDFDAALAHLKAHQVKFTHDIIIANAAGRLISFEDCEGNLVQILER